MESAAKKTLAAVLSFGTMSLLLGGCGANQAGHGTGAGTAGGTPVAGGHITLDVTQAVPDLDPAIAFDTTSAEVDYAIYEQLVTYDKGTYNIVGGLAQKWDVSSDGKTYTFHIRKGVKYSNGHLLKAQDFVYELERLLNPKMQPKPSPGSQFFMNITGATAFYKGQAKSISGVSTPDDHTLVIHLDKPESYFLKILAMPFLSAVDPSYVKQVGNAALDTSKAMGTGPFKLQTNSQSQVVLVKNPNYWKKDKNGTKLPYLNKITINVNNNGQLDALHWEQGQTAFISPWLMGGDGIPSAEYPTIMNTPKYSKLVLKQPENAVFYYGLNTKATIDGKKNPLSNVKVRQAIHYGFQDSQIIKLNNGAVKSLNQPLPDTLQGYVKKLAPDAQYSYNVTKAKQLLKQAGYANGFTMDLWNENTQTAKNEDQAFQAMMQKIGVHVKLHEVSWKTFLTKSMSGDAQAFGSGWNQDFPDASDFLNTLFNSDQIPSNNMTNYRNSQVDTWLNQAQYMTNQQKRNQLYGKVVNQVMRDGVFVPMYQPVGYYCVQPWVHGFYTSPVMYDPFAYIWIDQNHSS